MSQLILTLFHDLTVFFKKHVQRFEIVKPVTNKAELPLEGIFFCTPFSSLGIFISKKIGNRKN